MSRRFIFNEKFSFKLSNQKMIASKNRNASKVCTHLEQEISMQKQSDSNTLQQIKGWTSSAWG